MSGALTFAPLAAGLLLACNAMAQDHSHHAQAPASPSHAEHATQQAPATAAQHDAHQPAPTTAKPAPESQQATEATAHDHAAMGHEAPAQQPGAHDHAAMGHAAPRAADQPRTPIPQLTDADRAAAKPPSKGHPAHDNTIQSFVLFDRLEGFHADGGNGLAWEAQAWIGRDLDKLWLRSEGERSRGHTEAADIEVLYGRAVAPWWDVVAGVRHDFKPGASQDFAAIGIQGVAPYKFEVEATAYLGESGRTGARIEVEYDTLLTNRLILQPLLELEFHGQDDARRGIGSGLGTAEAGLRLRYEIRREFAPYVGLVHERAFGRTADFRRDDGEPVGDTRWVAGFRVWF